MENGYEHKQLPFQDDRVCKGHYDWCSLQLLYSILGGMGYLFLQRLRLWRWLQRRRPDARVRKPHERYLARNVVAFGVLVMAMPASRPNQREGSPRGHRHSICRTILFRV